MSKSNTYERQILALLLNGAAIANVADNAAGTPITALWVSLHTSDPADAGTQGTNETNYGGYTRISVTRSTAGFVVSTADGTASPVAVITFPQANTTSTGTLTHVSIGKTSASTAGDIFYSGALTPNIAYGLGVQPRVTTGSSVTED